MDLFVGDVSNLLFIKGQHVEFQNTYYHMKAWWPRIVHNESGQDNVTSGNHMCLGAKGRAARAIEQVHCRSKEHFPPKDRWDYWGERNGERGWKRAPFPAVMGTWWSYSHKSMKSIIAPSEKPRNKKGCGTSSSTSAGSVRLLWPSSSWGKSKGKACYYGIGTCFGSRDPPLSEPWEALSEKAKQWNLCLWSKVRLFLFGGTVVERGVEEFILSARGEDKSPVISERDQSRGRTERGQLWMSSGIIPAEGPATEHRGQRPWWEGGSSGMMGDSQGRESPRMGALGNLPTGPALAMAAAASPAGGTSIGRPRRWSKTYHQA